MLRLIRFGADFLTAVASGMYIAVDHMQGWEADGLPDDIWAAEQRAREKTQ